MSLLPTKLKLKKAQLRITLDEKIVEEINQYCQFIGYHKTDDFIEEAARHILSKDKSFKEWKLKQTLRQ